MKLSDFVPGAVFDCGSRAVSAEEIITFARRYDPQPFHIDAAEAARTPWRGLIASGWMTCGIAMELVVNRLLTGSGSIGSPGVDEIRWPNPVRPGDELKLVVTVLESRPSNSKPLQIVRWRWVVSNQSGDTVLTLVAASFFERAT